MPESAPTRYSAFDVAEERIWGGVVPYLTRRRAEGMGDLSISIHLMAEYGIDVTDEAVRQWRKAQGVA